MNRPRWLVWMLAMLVIGCQNPPGADPLKRDDAPRPTPAPRETPSTRAPAAAELLPTADTADQAAEIVASLQPVDDLWTTREILLHAALYREALSGAVANTPDHVLLQPVPAAELPNLSIDSREFYLRVLAALAPLDAAVAWTTIEPPARGQAELFPSSRAVATRLSFEILHRDDAEATVTAHVTSQTAHTGTSRQRVIAVFDGRNWHTTREGPRLIW